MANSDKDRGKVVGVGSYLRSSHRLVRIVGAAGSNIFKRRMREYSIH